ncbi:hypothetical protein [Cyclobacterium amurskyense]|uniref:Uncharacterized protein n=1 Tax=Cyclobacterium amurskyense TaxID=320787 RepID=A0A0H4P9B1_9BACT|nr:hypothetical protein [Cyclobacterium amurskyense]AKP50739.1 hypothetical protein CA2015_1291 [Cyclobacterium amurskyense]
MNKEAKQGILIALKKGGIAKVEASQLLKSNGIVLLDLSRAPKKIDPIEALLAKVPDLKNHFIRIVTLGNGKRP